MEYRIFFWDHEGHISRSMVIDRESDAEAMAEAAAHLKKHPAIEVWQLARMVGRLRMAPSPSKTERADTQRVGGAV